MTLLSEDLLKPRSSMMTVDWAMPDQHRQLGVYRE